MPDLIRRYPDIFTDMPGETDVIQHKVNLTYTPIRCKPYPLPCHKVRVLEMRVLRPSTSLYALSVFMVKKKDGSNRVCVDIRKLNKITEVDLQQITTAEDLLRLLSGKKYLFKFDLTKETGRYLLLQRVCTREYL